MGNPLVPKPPKILPEVERMTAPTFPLRAGIDDWVARGNLKLTIACFNQGGKVASDGVYTHKHYYLMRLYDVMEDMGKDLWEQHVPGTWDRILGYYKDAFSNKI